MTEEGNDGRVVVSPSLRMIGTSGFSGNLNPRREVKSMGKMARMLCKKYLDFDKFWKRKLELPKSGYPSEAGFRMLVSAAYLTLDYMKNWHRFKQVEPEFANAMYESFRNGWPHVATAVLSAMNDHQVYRITEGLVECLKVTKGCPTEWHRDQLVPPFRAVTFMLPKGAIVLPDGNSIDYVMTGIITEKELNSIGVETAQGNDTFMIVASSENQNCVYHTKLRFKDDDYLDLEPRMDYRDTVRDFGANLPWSVDEDKDVLFLVTDVVLMLLAILNGDKVPVTPARRIRSV